MNPLSDAALAHLRGVAAEAGRGARYTLLEPVGEGGMGTVYRAHDAELDREVAAKVLRAGGSAELVARFRQEGRILARLEHPGIVPVHDAGTLPDGRAFYVMTLVRGQRLDAAARALPTLAERLRLFQRICEPVAFAHSQGVIHRDLKPANIMVGPFGEVLVMDWGVAKVLGADLPAGAESGPAAAAEGITAHGAILGTTGFMAPEQAAGASAGVDRRADIFSLGAILEAITLDLAPLPRPLRAAIARARAAEPGDRYSDVAALTGDIGRFLDGEPLRAYPESLGERLVRLGRRYRTPLVLVLAYLVMRLLLLAFARI